MWPHDTTESHLGHHPGWSGVAIGEHHLVFANLPFCCVHIRRSPSTGCINTKPVHPAWSSSQSTVWPRELSCFDSVVLDYFNPMRPPKSRPMRLEVSWLEVTLGPPRLRERYRYRYMYRYISEDVQPRMLDVMLYGKGAARLAILPHGLGYIYIYIYRYLDL